MKKRLADIADIRTGFQFRGAVTATPSGNARVIQIKDLDSDRRILFDGLVTVQVPKPEPYLVQQGDVLFLSRGHRLFAVEVAEPLEGVIATGYFFILRRNTELLNSAYLAWWLNQPEFHEEMRTKIRGTHMPLISIRDFVELTIRIPPLAVQETIVRVNELMERENRLTAELQAKRTALVHALSVQAVHMKQKRGE